MKLHFSYFPLISIAVITSALAQPYEDWVLRNRFIQLSMSETKQRYSEVDVQNLTPNGILDSESGLLRNAGAQIRWQTANGWMAQLLAHRQNGASDYDGYLQLSNGALRPYRTITGNVNRQLSVYFGLALNDSAWSLIAPNFQFTPIAYLANTSWQRKLTQYDENYSYRARAAGVLAQWQLRPNTYVEVLALRGSMRNADITAPSFNFSAVQPGGKFRQNKLSAIQDLGSILNGHGLKNWYITLEHSRETFNHTASSVLNGLQAPPSQQSQGTWSVGLRRQF